MITVPIRTGQGLNNRGHWRLADNRTKAEKTATAWILTREAKPELPCSVILTRIAPSNGLDDDNLVGSLKAVRDAVAEWLGVDDKHSAIVRYCYAQSRGPWGVRIAFHKSMTWPQLPITAGSHGEVLGKMP